MGSFTWFKADDDINNCRWAHEWCKWEQYTEEYKWTPGRLAPQAIQGKQFVGERIRQRRYCQRCNFMQDVLVKDC